MITLEETEIIGWKHAIRGMRNPLNSWDKSDSDNNCPMPYYNGGCDCCDYCSINFQVGHNDEDLMKRLRNAGTDHRKFMRMIVVYVDITAPLYWWKEFDTYKVGTVANSCSTMHKIHAKEFTLDDFSHEHLDNCDICATEDFRYQLGDYYWPEYTAIDILNLTIESLNFFRQKYLETKNKHYWWQMIQLLPSSYNQKRTVMLNYEVLANMYKSRKDHKLDEWHTFCDWIRDLPLADDLIVGPEAFGAQNE